MKTSDIISAIAAQAVLGGAAVRVGAEFRFEADVPGRIVFVPSGARYEMAERHTGTNPRAIRTRVARYDAYCWGQSLDDAEALLNNLCAAIHLTLGDYELMGDTALAKDGDGVSNLGFVLVLHVEFRVPVTLPEDTTLEVVQSSPVPGASVELFQDDLGMEFADGVTVTGSPSA